MSVIELNASTPESRRANAAFWDKSVGKNGHKYWKKPQEPTLTHIPAGHLGPDTPALNLATGNGLSARWLAGRCGDVLATDGSEELVEEKEEGEEVGMFDVVLMNMAVSGSHRH